MVWPSAPGALNDLTLILCNHIICFDICLHFIAMLQPASSVVVAMNGTAEFPQSSIVVSFNTYVRFAFFALAVTASNNESVNPATWYKPAPGGCFSVYSDPIPVVSSISRIDWINTPEFSTNVSCSADLLTPISPSPVAQASCMIYINFIKRYPAIFVAFSRSFRRILTMAPPSPPVLRMQSQLYSPSSTLT